MILFFIMAMMAAYANRNLIFEQRIASNYARAGIALDIADGGAEWALALLNGGNIDAACQATQAATTSFAQRYLAINAETRALSAQAAAPFMASGVRTPNGWVHQCPAAGAWAPPTIDATSQLQPSFAISIGAWRRPGTLLVTSLGCTATDPAQCSDQSTTRQRLSNEQLLSFATVRFQAALVSALKAPPTAPLTVGQDVGGTTSVIGLHNSAPNTGGLLLAAGGTVDSNALETARLESLPGTPGQQAMIQEDSTLAARRTAGTMFSLFFGMTPEAYQRQPAVRTVDCSSGGDCSASLQAAIASGARMLWVNGSTSMATSNAAFGSTSQPVIILVNGALTLDGPLIVNGVIYASQGLTWSNGSGAAARLNGAAISERSFTATGPVDLVYDASIINILANATGSFVRVPGSWSDMTN